MFGCQSLGQENGNYESVKDTIPPLEGFSESQNARLCSNLSIQMSYFEHALRWNSMSKCSLFFVSPYHVMFFPQSAFFSSCINLRQKKLYAFMDYVGHGPSTQNLLSRYQLGSEFFLQYVMLCYAQVINNSCRYIHLQM